MGETVDEAPQQHLRMLLARAQNPFDVSDEALERLADAVQCQVDIQVARTGGPPVGAGRCGTARHTFLLADGGVQSLWELWRPEVPVSGGTASPGPSGEPRCEIYEHEDALRRSELRARGGGPAPFSTFSAAEEDVPGPGEEDDGFARLLLEECGLGRLWTREDSPGHARRLIGRAENRDRPGEETLRLLAGARGHDIVHVPKPRVCPPGRRLWCSLYEHVFLLPDGTEVSLYELEHNLTGGEGLVCEVYPDAAVADRVALRYARERGIDL
ncbi:hypothetical protein N566_15755 [Streptomycetaceae bacterium MP113-05]|nr:hypothetical protein N566_15755 [Streptomycetaceae bacterium MP113-05]